MKALVFIIACVLFSACQPRVANFPVEIETAACSGASPIESVTHLMLRVSGPDLEPLVKVSPLGSGELEIPEIPAGPSRRLEARAYAGRPDDAGSKLVSIGTSRPFDVPHQIVSGEKPAAIHVFLRRVNSFTPVSTADAPGTCRPMLNARAGHSATLLADGRVLIAGGWLIRGGKEESIPDAEIFDPATGTFTATAKLEYVDSNNQHIVVPRAFHSATRLTDGRVFLAGGEILGPTPGTDGRGLIFDPERSTYSAVNLIAPRARHLAALDKTGQLLLLGGNVGSQLVSIVEWFDVAKGRMSQATNLSFSAVGHALISIDGGNYLATAGGLPLRDTVSFFTFDGVTYRKVDPGLRMATARRNVAAAALQTDNRFLVLGGDTSSSEAEGIRTVTTNDLVSTGDSLGVSAGPVLSTPRRDVCAVTLADGRVLTVGGLTVDAANNKRSETAAELFAVQNNGKVVSSVVPGLQVGRHQHTCTPLPDGTVLIVGGVKEALAGREPLKDALIYTPEPLDR